MKKQLLLLFVAILFSSNNYSQTSIITQEADCATGCSNLTANFPAIQETTDYTVASIPFNSPANFEGLNNSIFLNGDDIWSSVVNLPFDFSFYGNSYNQLIIGANGVISFNVSNANTGNGWSFTEPLPNNTNPTLSDANIFGAGHDIDPAASNETHDIAWQIIGEAPFRMFVASFYNVAHFSCNDLKTTQMMVLYETTNVIEVYLLDKPLCDTWNNGNAVVGIQNPQGTEAVVPPGRNTGQWTATNEAWRFVPSGSNYENTYAWYTASGDIIGAEANINICPTAEEVYTAEVEFYNPNTGLTETVTNDITLFVNYDDASFYMTPTCDGATATITGVTGGVFIFNPTPADGVVIDVVTGTVTGATPGATYTVEYTTFGSCPSSSTETFTVLSSEDASFSLTSDCSGGATVVITGNTGGTFTFNPVILDGSSINATTGEITNGVSGTTYNVEYTTSGSCASSSSENVPIFDSAIEIVTPLDMEVCTPNEFEVSFNLTTQTNVITGGSTCKTVTYYESLVDAENNTNVINTPEAYPNSSNPQTIYVRVEDSTTGSYETTMFDLIVNILPDVYSDIVELVSCDLGNGFAEFDLTEADILITNGNIDVEVAYYLSTADAENQNNALAVSTFINTTPINQTIIARVDAINNQCYVLVACYLNVVNGVNLDNIGALIECGTNGISFFDLVTHVYQEINGSTTAELTFFLTQEDAETDQNVIFPANDYANTSNPQTVFVKAQDINSGCVSYGSFELNVEDAATINTPTPLTVCDFDGAEDGLYVFSLNQKDTEVLAGLGSESYNITYHETQTDAEAGVNALNNTQYYNTIPNIQTVYVRVENLNVGCISYTTLDLIVDTGCQVSCEENVTFCYTNNVSTYTYSNDNGVPLTVIFNAGQVENNFDELVVLDSDGVTNLNADNPYGNNGDLSGLTFTSTGDSITIIIDSDGSISCETQSYTEIDFYVFCYVESGSIEVNAFIDENSDTVFDASEVNFSNGEFSYEVNNDGVTNYVNSSSGSFIIPTSQVGDTYDITFTMFDEFNSCLAQTFTLVEDVAAIEGQITEVNFPLTVISNCNDIAVYLSANGPPRPGILYNNILIIENLGSIPVSGSVEFTHDGSVTLDNVSNVDSGNTVTNTATGFILNFNNLLAGNTEQVNIQLNVPTNLNIGDLITNSVVYSVSDINLNNNQSSLTLEVINSYDPNNKFESHGPEIKLDEFTNEDYLYYTINFQNLGTAEALDIRVEDVLDAQLDASTFKMLNASHDFMVTRVDNNLTWQFDDINLPSESMDEPNSHGYVYFKVKPLGYQEGDIIPNEADIYFDFNSAITTNTFETKFVTSLSIGEFSAIGYNMYPNPANSIVNIQFNTAVAENVLVSIYNVQGKLVSNPSTVSNENKISFNVTNLSQGMYFVELKGESFKVVEKLIIE